MTVSVTGVRERIDAGIEWTERAALDALNSMGLRATARLLATVTTEAGLVQFLEWAKGKGEEFVVLGEGTNVIFGDEFLNLVILRFGGDFARAAAEGEAITAGAAVPLARLIREAHDAGLSGLEDAWGIPGSLGGAIVGNAGTADWAIGDCVSWVEVFDRSGTEHRLTASEIGFGYRQSTLAGQVIVRARLDLKRDSDEHIDRRIERARARRSGQPHGARSAGCIFKNPPGKSAGQLIETAGLKGLRRGGAVLSTDHANFILNENNATSGDVVGLIDEVRRRVFEQFGITLEMEVHILRSAK